MESHLDEHWFNVHVAEPLNDQTSPREAAIENEKAAEEGLELKRKVGLFSGIAFIVGNMIGSGIFVTPGGILERSGSVGLSLILWAACGLLAIFGSLAYAELGTMIPKSGGEYAYFMAGLGHLHPFWGLLTAFLYSWITILLLRPASLAAGCLSFARYTLNPILASSNTHLHPDTQDIVLKVIAVVFLALIIAINCLSINWSLWIGNVSTVGKLLAVVILIICGIYQLCIGQTQYLAQGFNGTSTDFGVIALAFYGGLWAFDGWNNLNYITEELKDPYVTLPRAIVIGIPLVTFCYLAVNVAYLTVLSPAELVKSPTVAVDVANRLLGPMAFIIPLAVALSVFGSVLSTAFSIGRLCFASAREGHMIDVMSYIHVEFRTPIPSLLISFILTVLMIVVKDVAALIDFFTFVTWIFYVLAMVLVLILRKTMPDASRPYRVPLVIPIIVALAGCYLIVSPIISEPKIEYVYILVVILAGVVFYAIFVYKKHNLDCIMSPMTRVIQLALNVAPPTKPIPG